MNEKSSFQISQGYDVLSPRSGKAYPILCEEWDFLKNNIRLISDTPNIYIIIGTLLLGASISTLISILIFGICETSPISSNCIISWATVAVTLITGIVSVYFGFEKRNMTEKKASDIVSQMELIEAKYKSEEIGLCETPIETVFTEVFDSFNGWEQYLEGSISHSNEVSPHTGQFCLKKDHNNDPHGGYKIIGKSIGLGFIFSGWIFRPSGKPGGKGDRLGIEDMHFNGYGFSVAHGANFVVIESRERGKATEISNRISFNPPQDVWYNFEFHSSSDRKFVLYINDFQGDRLIEITAVDSKYSKFDRITIHGGHPYFIDNLKVTKT